MTDEPLSASVRSLLEDDLFRTPGETPNGGDNEPQEAYKRCLALFVRDDVKHCLEEMLSNGLLVPDGPMEVYDLALTAFSRIANFQTLGVSLKNVARDLFTGDYEPLLINPYYSHSQESALGFLQNYFTCCVRTIPIRHDPEFPVLVQDSLRMALVHQCKLLWEDGGDSAVVLPYLQKLVQIYIFGLEIKYMGSSRSPKLYTRVCEAVPHLSQLLSENVDRTGVSYEQLIVGQLQVIEQTKEKEKAKPQVKTTPDVKVPVDTTTTRSDKKEETETPAATVFDTAQQYIRDTLSQNPHVQSTLDYLSRAREHPLAIVAVAVVTVGLIRRHRRRIRYILRNVAGALGSLAPHIVALLRLLAST
ncbi:Pex15 protein [Maudiozyma humilis]|uniref:Pex15 protein n=1 Tax=Maudiozyma humilis TaxID=51915 RepID=A0AAV5S023_MAUHU|nr:Pex15 protein [Kazachstania humilis]